MDNRYGHFDDARREFVVTDPLTPAPWINYLSNTTMTAFISQQAGGPVFGQEPQNRRISRYHWLPAPQDRPGFYVYVRDNATGTIWNPHFAPTCVKLDAFECRHGLGYTRITGERDAVRVTITYFIPPGDDVMLWDVNVENRGTTAKSLTLESYLEFGLLEAVREQFWCYLKNHIGFEFDPAENWIKYIYHAFEAPYTPAVFFSSTRKADGFDCSRDAFCGRGGSLERPSFALSGSQLPGGGHGCGNMGAQLQLAPGVSERFAYITGIADDWPKAAELKNKFASIAAVDTAFAKLGSYWGKKTGAFQAQTGDAHVDRMINIWNPLNCQITLERTRDISTVHTGWDGLRYRDTMQDALAIANIDPEFAKKYVRLIFGAQAQDGSACFSLYPFAPKLKVTFNPHRCDNNAWPIYTVANLVNETGDLSFFDEPIPFRDGGTASVYDHIRLGLHHIWERRGPTGLPTLFHADWNDGLAVFLDENAESVMLGMQLVYSAKMFREFAAKLGRDVDVEWCDMVAKTLDDILNSDAVWDGQWYRRLLLANGMKVGSNTRPEGKIYLEPQAWAVLSGVGREGRGQLAMDSAFERLNTPHGLMICAPPYTGIPNPEDPLTSNSPGTGENGSIFCHANTWAIIAECLLGRGDRAFEIYRQLLPSVVAEELGQDRWAHEPYVFSSTVIGPARGEEFGKAGISWLTGTASWMYIAATQYILGLQPTLAGLRVRPCLPKHLSNVRVTRKFRGKSYDVEFGDGIRVNGERLNGNLIR